MSRSKRPHAVEPRLLSLDDAAHYLGISKDSVEAYVASGKIVTMRLRAPAGPEMMRRTLVDRRELDRFIETEGIPI